MKKWIEGLKKSIIKNEIFKKKPKIYNVRRVIFTLHSKDEKTFVFELVGKLVKRQRWLSSRYEVEYVNPQKTIEYWGTTGFIRINPKSFLKTDQVKKITFKITIKVHQVLKK